MRRLSFPLIPLAASLLLGAGSSTGNDKNDTQASADRIEPEFIGDAVKCVSIARIDRTEIVDSSRILFYMHGGTIYLNALPRKCPGMRSYNGFSYRTSLSQLCNVDTITVLRRGGPGLTPGATCGLGMFRPVTEETALMLRTGDVPEAEPAKVSPEIEPGAAESGAGADEESEPADTR